MDGARSDGEGLVVVRWVADEFRGGVLLAVLEGAGIRARVVTDDPTGITGVFGATSDRRVAVMVRREDAARAEAVLREGEEGGGVDWEDVDVGEGEDELARRIASGEVSGRAWWWGGWPASVVLLVCGFVALAISPTAAWVLWLGALIAAVGSAGSWVVWRARGGGSEEAGSAGDGGGGEESRGT